MANSSFIRFTKKGIYCVPGRFYLDPWRPVDLALITHGHGDHARWGMKKYLCQRFTEPILKLRIGEDIEVQSVEYGEELIINGVKVSFFPAGHIVGSAQIRMEYKGKVIVYSGDYKVQDDGISTPFELVKCHEFVTESTFGLPIYNWMPPEDYSEKMQTWAAKNRDHGKTSVFVGYSLGKAQRIMKSLENSGRIFVHSSIARLNQAMESVGIELPQYDVIDFYENPKETQGEIVIVPPALLDSNVIKKIPERATAICSGWMQVRGSRRWRAADAGFAISDHADWQGLIQTIKETEAERIYVTHGQTEVFSKYLNEIGLNAEPVTTVFGSEEEDEETSDVAE